MKDERILRKIRACLQMAGDTGSPEEAAIAAGQARALMDKYQISELDLKSSEPSDFGQATYLRVADYAGMLAIAMGWLNDCTVDRVTGKRGSLNMRFQGYLVDAITAKELYIYLLAQAEVQSKKVRGRKAHFKEGFAVGVQQQVRRILREREQVQMGDGTSLVVYKKAIVEQRFGVTTTSAYPGHASAAYSAGKAAGNSVGLNRQVSGLGQKKLT